MDRENKKVNVGVMGVAFYAENKGCSALGYSFLHILEIIAEKNNINIEVFIFTFYTNRTFFKWMLNSEYRKNIIPKSNSNRIKCLLAPETTEIAISLTKRLIGKCDIIIDFTGGDSFTDLYGKDRFYKKIFFKKIILDKKIPLILGSQTYGPFNDLEVQKDAKKIIKKAYEVFSRDIKSDKYILELCGRKTICVTDMAFILPYEKKEKENHSKVKIGINVSGLLWEGGYTRDNQFGLTVDYKRYCYRILEYLISRKDKYDVYIIPHVLGAAKKGIYIVDNDMIPYNILKKKYTEVYFSPEFSTPMEAKSYIAQMDIFIGARMHATIAAFSSGVATIPFSYSRKFEGLYESLGYRYTISGTVLETDVAIRKTIEEIEDYQKLQKISAAIMEKEVKQKLDIFEERVSNILASFVK